MTLPTYIITVTSKKLDFANMQPEQICLEDIASALARTPRFAGHTRKAYSVAQHSALVAQLVPSGLRRQALLHDATEAYMCDLPSPLKQFLPDYRAMEAKLWEVIANKFDVPVKMDQWVKDADQEALRIEAHQLFADPDWCPLPVRNGVELPSNLDYNTALWKEWPGSSLWLK